ncbi:3-phenylpropionate/cinnamic acid dioxygenase subunit beta [Mycolicibacterium sp. D5.8-2]|uniref:3-phenylpropionate/cinnamic acid dioxygenase subunit beta n=1 Tax=Mycolicibacterium sp. D5.8-2 TaxID=3085903 RepID=UPI000811CBE6|nr:3-phenylpropionate/cinnamic acid dioxygenase subunit beta [Mycolicibacterium sp. D5.8-2]ANW68279.1 benzene 1,2-dioxygenase [Mycobacterium sp. djl-10]MDW5615143.1 3-phenylpropionate/cinnamic acid dioxygenase subunit beta [Mycolicibacterium sp. D5.8-2]
MSSHLERSAVPVETGVTVELQHKVEQFLYAEAQLLDDWCYRDWFDLMADDIRYRAPLRKNRLRRQRQQDEVADRGTEMALFDDDKESLDIRIRQRETGKFWAEDPPSRTRHLITNVRISLPADCEGDHYRVRSNFLVYRNRLETEVDLWAGERFDELRPVGDSFRIARRTVLLDQNVVLSKNLSVFF